MRRRDFVAWLAGLRAAADEKPVVVVIGTLHAATANFTSRDLVEALRQVMPAAILFEVDSSFFDRNGRLRRVDTLEGHAVQEFLRTSRVVVRPYDIEGRNRIYEAFGYFKLQRDFTAVLHVLYRENRLCPEARSLYQEVLADYSSREVFGKGRMALINTPACDTVVERKNERWPRNMKRIIGLTPELARFAEYVEFHSEFWQLRNRTMVRNILRHAQSFPGRRIVVLCGFEHRYFLIRELKAASAISLREYREFGSC
jgi:hypothetical protein